MVRIGNACNKRHLLPQAWIFGFLYTYGSSIARLRISLRTNSRSGMVVLFSPGDVVQDASGDARRVWGWPRPLGSDRRAASPVKDWWTVFALAVAPNVYLAVAMHSNLDIGLRHVFPVYPFLFIFLGAAAAQVYRRWPKATRRVLVLLFAGLIAETAWAYPDYIPFFNVAAGGSRGGLRLLSDCNIDWGQDLPALARWQREHPDRQLYLCQFALPDPRYYGIHYIAMPGAYAMQEDETAATGLPPVYAISAVALQGTYMPAGLNHDIYVRFLRTKPFEVLDGTIYLFDQPPP